MAEFKNDLVDIIEKFHRYESELLSAYENSTQFDFKFAPNIEIKNGMNWTGAISSIIGGIVGVIICLSNPAGWVVLALSILGLGISIGKGILEFVNNNYRTAQQKKAADDNIEKMGDEILKLVVANLKDAHIPLHESIANMKDDLHKSVKQINTLNQVFHSAEKKFGLLTAIVEKEGAN